MIQGTRINMLPDTIYISLSNSSFLIIHSLFVPIKYKTVTYTRKIILQIKFTQTKRQDKTLKIKTLKHDIANIQLQAEPDTISLVLSDIDM